MKKLWILLIIFPVLFLSTNSCEDSSGNDEDSSADSTAILSGQVLNSENLEPIQSAIVMIMEHDQDNTRTNAYGLFEIEFELEGLEQIHLIAAPTGYIPDTSSTIWISPGEIVDSISLRPIPTGEILVPSGNASSIILSSVTPTSIGVRESGGAEVAAVTFVVLDSTGRPIDGEHSVNLNFYLGGSPGGGLFFTPSTAQTGGDGKVTTYLFSGDSAGVVQIIAAVDQPGLPIRSKPVAVVIHGGFPDIDHFSVGPENRNMAGNILNVANPVTAIVGDKYGNPVKEGTAVYFTTSSCIIGGSGFTDNMGRTRVDFITALPLPNENGVAWITAQTADENEEIIEAYNYIVISGVPIISTIPTEIDVPNNASQTIKYTVADIRGNPMAEGQTIEVAIEAGDVEITGDTKITLEDVVDSTFTLYQFKLTDAEPDSVYENKVEVRIKTTGDNGTKELLLEGYAH